MWFDEYNPNAPVRRPSGLGQAGLQQGGFGQAGLPGGSGQQQAFQPGSVKALRARREQEQQQQQQAPKKNFFQDNISTAGGIGGALAGAAGGAAIGSVVPGLGTIIGGLIGSVVGGAGGSGAGQLAENAITGEQDLGKGVLQETLMGGLFSAPPIRGAKAVFGAGKALAGGAGGQVAKQAAETALTQPGMLAGLGQSLRGGARGVEVGVKSSGARLTPQKAKEINSFLENTVKVKGSTAAKQSEGLERFIADRNAQLTSAIEKSNRTLTGAEKRTLADNLQKNFNNTILSPNPRQSQILNDTVVRVRQSPDVKTLDDFRKIVDGQINFNRTASSVEPGAEQVWRLIRGDLTDAVAGRVGSAKSIKTDLSKAFDAQDLLLSKATGGFGQFPTTLGTVPLPRSATQTVQNLGGRAAGTIDNIASNRLVTAPVQQIGGRMLTGTNQGEAQALEDTLMQNQQFGGQPLGGQDTNQLSGVQGQFGGQGGFDQMGGQQQSQNPYPQENLLFDLQRDPANAQAYIQQFQQLQEIFAPAQQGTELSQTALTQIDSLDNSLLNLDFVERVLQENQGAFDPIRGRLASLNPYDDTANKINQASLVAAQNIGRALEGGKLTDNDIARYQRALPNINDTPDQAQNKIDELRRLVTLQKQNYVGLQDQFGGGGNTLQDALMNAQQGGF